MMGELSYHRMSALDHPTRPTVLADAFFRFHLGTYHLSRKYKLTLTLKKQSLLSHIFQGTPGSVLQKLVHYQVIIMIIITRIIKETLMRGSPILFRVQEFSPTKMKHAA